jgi:hypothetical protein
VNDRYLVGKKYGWNAFLDGRLWGLEKLCKFAVANVGFVETKVEVYFVIVKTQ